MFFEQKKAPPETQQRRQAAHQITRPGPKRLGVASPAHFGHDLAGAKQAQNGNEETPHGPSGRKSRPRDSQGGQITMNAVEPHQEHHPCSKHNEPSATRDKLHICCTR